jgi:acetoin utilization deacetylase AcuC-like enzyme
LAFVVARVALLSHPWCNRHRTGPAHPEGEARLPAIVHAVHADPELAATLADVEARPVGLQDLLRVHQPEHLERIRRAADRAARLGGIQWLDPDTAVAETSFEAALAAAGCAADAAVRVARGEAVGAFALCRPPGHHATATEAMGFCLFNNVAIAARRVQATCGVRRVLVVDWDVHHGNGTEAIFREDPTVYYLSLHLADHYPGTGAAAERGSGAGAGTTRNVPLRLATTAAEYRRRFVEALDATLDEFSPELVLVSAGFDCLAEDPLGGLLLEPEDLHALTAAVLDRTRRTAGGRVAAVLEGGYVPDRMGRGAANVLRALAGLPAAAVASLPEAPAPSPG